MADTLGDSKSKYRVALASSDGENVNIHYGKSNLFYIYYVDDETGYDLVEKRSVKPVCQEGSHVKLAMEESVKQFEDCKYVVASRIGAGAVQALTSSGIISMELPGSIDEAILKVWKYNRVQGLFA
jgi:predicted Fe-Mo cluster-binding NifX family protein